MNHGARCSPAHYSALRGSPYATVRVISDTASEDLPLDFNAPAKLDKNPHFGRLAWATPSRRGKSPR
jgi:hypothetical protein